jgi:hypothetical protein
MDFDKTGHAARLDVLALDPMTTPSACELVCPGPAAGGQYANLDDLSLHLQTVHESICTDRHRLRNPRSNPRSLSIIRTSECLNMSRRARYQQTLRNTVTVRSATRW